MYTEFRLVTPQTFGALISEFVGGLLVGLRGLGEVNVDGQVQGRG